LILQGEELKLQGIFAYTFVPSITSIWILFLLLITIWFSPFETIFESSYEMHLISQSVFHSRIAQS